MDISAAQIEDDFADGESQAVSLFLSGGIALIEFLKNVFAGFLRHADAAVSYRHGEIVMVPPQGDGNGRIRIGELDSVSDEIGPDLE